MRLPGNGCLAALILIIFITASGCASVQGSRPELSESVLYATPIENKPKNNDIEPTVVSYTNYNDPLIKINQAIFSFNDVTNRYILIPLSKGYMKIIPAPVHESIGNFFYNIKMPIYAVNHFLQLQPRLASQSIARFLINTTLGLFGIFDPASDWFEIERVETHFEDTLSSYGFGYGIFIVLPFFGPSDLRNGASRIVDYVFNPLPYLLESPVDSIVMTYDFFQDYAPQAEQYSILREKSEDPYIFFRNLYLQGIQRDAEY